MRVRSRPARRPGPEESAWEKRSNHVLCFPQRKRANRTLRLPGLASRQGAMTSGGGTLMRMVSGCLLGHDTDVAVSLENGLLDRTDVAYAALAQVGKKLVLGELFTGQARPDDLSIVDQQRGRILSDMAHSWKVVLQQIEGIAP